jgi:hypothetical protein
MAAKRHPYLWIAMTMTETPDLEPRLRSVLAPTARRAAFTRKETLLGLALAASLMAPLALLQPILARAEPPSAHSVDKEAACRRNLHRLSVALQIYAMDYDGHLPPLSAPDKLQTVLAPYAHGYVDWAPALPPVSSEENAQSFSCPETGIAYQPTTQLSGRSLTHTAGSHVVLRDAVAHTGAAPQRETMNYASLDGKVFTGKANMPFVALSSRPDESLWYYICTLRFRIPLTKKAIARQREIVATAPVNSARAAQLTDQLKKMEIELKYLQKRLDVTVAQQEKKNKKAPTR